MPGQFTRQTVKDGFLTYEGGMNSGSVPELLKPNELALLVNGTVRGGFVTNRPAFNQKTLTFPNSSVQTAVETGRWQGASYFQTQEANGCIVASIGGRIFRFNIAGSSPNVAASEIITSDSSVNNANGTQSWLWQSRDWMIINDGQSLPIFYNGSVARRSAGAPNELPSGRMGAFGNGRNWMSLPDGQSYIASDLEGGPGALGVPAYLRTTENTYMNGGGSFKVPSGSGTIYAMRFVAIPDTSLGQGPLQVFTPNTVFSCNTPVDRAVWTTLENPIQTTSLIANGGLSHYSTISVNSDLFFRSGDGVRSWILGRREFTTWGNTPISREINRILANDDPSLLFYSSAIYFDNRMLMTCSPVFTQQGVWHHGLVALDFDIISSMRGKSPAVWDGLWTGMQVLQMVKGIFSGVERAFAFVLYGDTTDRSVRPVIQIWEILKTDADYQDNRSIPITWQFETGDCGFNSNGLTDQDMKRLVGGEVFVDQVLGAVTFQVDYRPDSYACWVPWHRWMICAKDRLCETGVDGCMKLNNVKPQYRNRMGLGEPSGQVCDDSIEVPTREGTSFTFRYIITGTCRVRKQRYLAVPVPEDIFARMECTPDNCDLNTQ